jgi:hypothetical protein
MGAPAVLPLRRFHDHYRREHAAFVESIQGLREQADREGYASLMLNRLMFLFCLQKQGFLDGHTDYLSDRLTKVRQRRAAVKTATFYRSFLLVLFHQGLSRQPRLWALSADQVDLLGNVPCLTGGLFDVHEHETHCDRIDIPDGAFQRLFDCFDRYDWRLGSGPLRDEHEINSDVLAVLFEKTISQKPMGVYYTNEDVTDYISKNTLLPHLFEAARRDYAAAFEPGSALWRRLADHPDRYLYPALRRGVLDDRGKVIPLPPDIERGLDAVDEREGWDWLAAPDYALPGETWREHVARRRRCLALRRKLARGRLRHIDDLVTHNLDIGRFAADTIASCERSDLLRAFYRAVSTVTVVDPTCGTGAFLLAALRVLRPLYAACLDRMQQLVDELDCSEEGLEDFRTILGAAARCPSRDYFILESILVHNLYGVDLMREAVEVCKLRLLLELLAGGSLCPRQEGCGINRLPDLDSNLRHGNALVGFAAPEEVRRAEVGPIVLEHPGELHRKLDRALAPSYGVDGDPLRYAEWVNRHQPFHWLAEYSPILKKGGFDVVLGNPPYLERAKLGDRYGVRGYQTAGCPDIYAWFVERATQVLGPHGRLGLIVPVSVVSSERFAPLRSVLCRGEHRLWFSHFANRPGQLFSGGQNRLTVILRSASGVPGVFSSRYHRWDGRNGERDGLFECLSYVELKPSVCTFRGLFPKVGAPEGVCVLEKLLQPRTVSGVLVRRSDYPIYWVRVPGYFCQFFLRPPLARPKSGGKPRVRGEVAAIYCPNEATQRSHHAILNSSTWYQFFTAFTDGRHVNPSDVKGFPCDLARLPPAAHLKLAKLSRRLEAAMRENTSYRHKSELLVESVDSRATKPLLDQIDAVLAESYGFDAETLDHVISFDIKYRLGHERKRSGR